VDWAYGGYVPKTLLNYFQKWSCILCSHKQVGDSQLRAFQFQPSYWGGRVLTVICVSLTSNHAGHFLIIYLTPICLLWAVQTV
jgi:hypothetical protein